MKEKHKPIKFPDDEQVHDSIIEWWYFNGHLRDWAGKKYAFMDCLFKADTNKANIPFLKRVPTKNIYFAHSILSDIGTQKSYPEIQNISLVSNDSFTRPLLYANYTNPIMINGYVNSVIEEITAGNYHIKSSNFDLILRSQKPPLLVGGRGHIVVCNRDSYYYSLTNLKITGMINIGGKWIEVEGKAWMDHQWADAGYIKDKWTWFSFQLDNGIEMMCCEYTAGKDKDYLVDIIYADDKQ